MLEDFLMKVMSMGLVFVEESIRVSNTKIESSSDF